MGASNLASFADRIAACYDGKIVLRGRLQQRMTGVEIDLHFTFCDDLIGSVIRYRVFGTSNTSDDLIGTVAGYILLPRISDRVDMYSILWRSATRGRRSTAAPVQMKIM